MKLGKRLQMHPSSNSHLNKCSTISGARRPHHRDASAESQNNSLNSNTPVFQSCKGLSTKNSPVVISTDYRHCQLSNFRCSSELHLMLYIEKYEAQTSRFRITLIRNNYGQQDTLLLTGGCLQYSVNHNNPAGSHIVLNQNSNTENYTPPKLIKVPFKMPEKEPSIVLMNFWSIIKKDEVISLSVSVEGKGLVRECLLFSSNGERSYFEYKCLKSQFYLPIRPSNIFDIPLREMLKVADSNTSRQQLHLFSPNKICKMRNTYASKTHNEQSSETNSNPSIRIGSKILYKDSTKQTSQNNIDADIKDTCINQRMNHYAKKYSVPVSLPINIGVNNKLSLNRMEYKSNECSTYEQSKVIRQNSSRPASCKQHKVMPSSGFNRSFTRPPVALATNINNSNLLQNNQLIDPSCSQATTSTNSKKTSFQSLYEQLKSIGSKRQINQPQELRTQKTVDIICEINKQQAKEEVLDFETLYAREKKRFDATHPEVFLQSGQPIEENISRQYTNRLYDESYDFEHRPQRITKNIKDQKEDRIDESSQIDAESRMEESSTVVQSIFI